MTWNDWRESLRNILLNVLWPTLLLWLALSVIASAAALVWDWR